MSIHLYQRDGERYRDFLHRLRDHRSKITRERRREADMIRRARLPTPDDSDSETDASDCAVPEHLFPAVARALRLANCSQRRPALTGLTASSDHKDAQRMPRHLWRAASPPPRAVSELPRLRPRPWRLQPSTAAVSTPPVSASSVSRKRKRDEDEVPPSGPELGAAVSRKWRRVEDGVPQRDVKQAAVPTRKRKWVEEDVAQGRPKQTTNDKSVRKPAAGADQRASRGLNSKRRRAG